MFLLFLRCTLYRDAICGANLHAHFGHLPIDQHPALLNPGIGLAAGAKAQFGHALVQADSCSA
jgi:hypothetical protein